MFLQASTNSVGTIYGEFHTSVRSERHPASSIHTRRMTFLPDHPTSIAILVTVLTMVTTSAIQWSFLLGLKKRHPHQWRHAGSPTIWTDQSLFSAWPTVRYLQHKAYASSGDGAGIAFCSERRLPMVFGYWMTFAVFVTAVLVAISYGWPPGWS